MASRNFRDEIRKQALALLDEHPEGLHFQELLMKIKNSDETFKRNTISGSIYDLQVTYPTKVYKPLRGLYRLLRYKENETGESPAAASPIQVLGQTKIKEEDFYAPFVEWLQNEIEDVTRAIPLGGKKFNDKWGTPDVIGKRESRRSDLIKGPTEIVSAEIKSDTGQLITAFGQACAYRLFSHKVYLVIPVQAADEEISRLDALCQIFGIGLVTFDTSKVDTPDFRIMVRPSRNEPDLFYTNKYMVMIENDLFR
ncbi:MAG: hypothetical protein ORN29_09745 [Rhodoferax sp.]|nr:hypothetical protein [Rhodoferax sp.]